MRRDARSRSASARCADTQSFRARRSPGLCPQAKDVVRARVSCAHPSLLSADEQTILAQYEKSEKSLGARADGPAAGLSAASRRWRPTSPAFDGTKMSLDKITIEKKRSRTSQFDRWSSESRGEGSRTRRSAPAVAKNGPNLRAPLPAGTGGGCFNHTARVGRRVASGGDRLTSSA
jgi:hypothetical protein